jgi:hypothetical protein
MLYVNPLGRDIDLNAKIKSQIPRYNNYSNNINNLRKNNVLNNARLEDSEKKRESNKITFIIYSVLACIFIIIFLLFLKKLNS